jgi:two-component system, NarL family, response regulator LiaR
MLTNSPNKISILLADDQPMARAGIRSLLEQARDLEIVGEAEEGEQIKCLVAQLRPQVLLLDLVMPNLSPAELERWVRENYPETVTLVLTSHDRDAYLAAMLEAGAVGYFSKDESAERLISAIRRAVDGSMLFSDEQIARAQRWRNDAKQKWDSLTGRERQILRALADGLENKAIATNLNVSQKTIEKHLTGMYAKLGVTSRTEAALWQAENGRDFPHN